MDRDRMPGRPDLARGAGNPTVADRLAIWPGISRMRVMPLTGLQRKIRRVVAARRLSRDIDVLEIM